RDSGAWLVVSRRPRLPGPHGDRRATRHLDGAVGIAQRGRGPAGSAGSRAARAPRAAEAAAPDARRSRSRADRASERGDADRGLRLASAAEAPVPDLDAKRPVREPARDPAAARTLLTRIPCPPIPASRVTRERRGPPSHGRTAQR